MVINGQAYQIVTPVNLVSGNISVASPAPQTVTNVQYTSPPGGHFSYLLKYFQFTILLFLGSNSSSTGPVYLSGGASTTTSQQIVSVQNNGTNGTPVRILNN